MCMDGLNNVSTFRFKLDLYIENRYLNTRDREFVDNVESEIEEFLKRSDKNQGTKRVLVFPHVNNYKRFLIHKAVETYKQLESFSVGEGIHRRTVVANSCLVDIQEKQLMSNPRPPPARGRGRGRNNTRNQSPGVEYNEHLTQKSDEERALTPPLKGQNTGSGPGVTQSATRARRKRPEVQLYVPRGKRLQNQQNEHLTDPGVHSGCQQHGAPTQNYTGNKSAQSDVGIHVDLDSSTEAKVQEKTEDGRKQPATVNTNEKRRPRGRGIYVPPSRRNREQCKGEDGEGDSGQRQRDAELHTQVLQKEIRETGIRIADTQVDHHSSYENAFWDEDPGVFGKEESTIRDRQTDEECLGDIEQKSNIGHDTKIPQVQKLECASTQNVVNQNQSFHREEFGSEIESLVEIDESSNFENAEEYESEGIIRDSQKNSEQEQDSSIRQESKDREKTNHESNISVSVCSAGGKNSFPEHDINRGTRNLSEREPEPTGSIDSHNNSQEIDQHHDDRSVVKNDCNRGTGNSSHQSEPQGTIKDESELTVNVCDKGRMSRSATDHLERDSQKHEQHGHRLSETDGHFSDIRDDAQQSEPHMNLQAVVHTAQQSEFQENAPRIQDKEVQHNELLGNEYSHGPPKMQQTEINDKLVQSQNKEDTEEETRLPDNLGSTVVGHKHQHEAELRQESQSKSLPDEHLESETQKGTEFPTDLKLSSQQIEVLANKTSSQCNKEDTQEVSDCLDQSLRIIAKQEAADKTGSGPDVSHSSSKDRDHSSIQKEEKSLSPKSGKGAMKESETVDSQEETEEAEEDSWDKLFDDDGECLDPQAKKELKKIVGKKVKIDKAKINDHEAKVGDPEFDYEEMGHVIEIYGFSAELKTQDLLAIFQQYKDKGFDIKWVDDTHALGVFSSTIAAKDALRLIHPLCKVGPLSEASRASKIKARRCTEALQPYKPRPETSATLARRLVAGALGIQSKLSKEQREAERKKLKEAREKKRKDKKQREDMWEGTCRSTADDVS